MVNTCCVNGCTSRSNKEADLKFHRIPTVDAFRGTKMREQAEKRRRAWLQKINRKSITSITVKSWTRVCSKHFVTGKPSELFEENHPDWVPSLNMGHDSDGENKNMTVCQPKTEEDIMDSDRVVQTAGVGTHIKAEVLEVKHSISDSENETPDACAENVEDSFFLKEFVSQLHSENKILHDEKNKLLKEKNKLLEEKNKLLEEKISLSQEVQSLREENRNYKRKLGHCTFSEDSFIGDDTRVKYYTGLPNFLVLMALVNQLAPVISSGPRSVTSKFQEIVMVLMRLRLNLSLQVLADIFWVSSTTVSRLFCKIIDVMHVHLCPSVLWPERGNVHRTMPKEFVQCFGNKVPVLIDFLELLIKTPSDPLQKAQTFSLCKHRNTVKYLIAIVPQGAVTFISKGWGGGTSNEFMIEISTFLNNLEPGDLVFAHRGVNNHGSTGLMCAEVTMKEGKKQLSAFDTEAPKSISHFRFNIEKLISNITLKYQMLDSPIPVAFLSPAVGETVPMIDKLVTVCCALENMCPAVSSESD